MNICTIKNYAGRAFNVKLIEVGEWYGRDPSTGAPCFQADELMLEFWDATYSSHGPMGQFVSRYYVRTMKSRDPAYDLNMDGNVPMWWVGATQVREVMRHLCGLHPDYAKKRFTEYPPSNDEFREVDPT